MTTEISTEVEGTQTSMVSYNAVDRSIGEQRGLEGLQHALAGKARFHQRRGEHTSGCCQRVHLTDLHPGQASFERVDSRIRFRVDTTQVIPPDTTFLEPSDHGPLQQVG